MSGYVPWSVGWSLVPRTFPRMSCSLVFLPALFAAFISCAREKCPQTTHPHSAVPVALDPRVDPTSELAIYAVFGPGKQPIAEPPPAASPQLERCICQQGLRSARIRGLLRVLAAGAAGALTTNALAFSRHVTTRTSMIIFTVYSITCVAHGLLCCRVCGIGIVALCNAPRRVCGLLVLVDLDG